MLVFERSSWKCGPVTLSLPRATSPTAYWGQNAETGGPPSQAPSELPGLLNHRKPSTYA